MNRRALILAAGALGGLFAAFRRGVAKTLDRLRPPGAKPPGEFERTCIRCYRCAEVCPTKAIRFDSFLSPRASDTPFIEARLAACVLCMQCTEACPTGALVKTPADKATVQATVRMGKPVLERKHCLPWNGKGLCRLCYYACPYPDTAIQLVGPQQAPMFEAKSCVGCGLCEEACPESARAIRIVPFDEGSS